MISVVAIDGPAASGKSSTAHRVAKRLGLVHIDSGALYRVATWLAVEYGLQTAAEVVEALEQAGIALVREGIDLTLYIAGSPVSSAIRSADVTARVSEVAAMPEVREWINRRLREAVAEWGGAVMDGRDIGSVVFPDAILKVFLTATPEARAARRLRQDGAATPPAEAIAHEAARLAARDRFDASRSVAPLVVADGARQLDTTQLGFDEQVEQILRWADSVGLPVSE